ncbi:MAG: flavodoxin-dependent (E)-4-hydroxy-3-methylbut-2-enyl-diphosphate synthase, partial [Syntrophales bacterium]
MDRRKTRPVFIGGVQVGGGAPVIVQSMTSTDTRDVRATVKQIVKLSDAGCEIVRVAVPDMCAAETLSEIKARIALPLIADIHFDYRLALEALRQGVDGLRVNPGNLSRDGMKKVVKAAKERSIPIRIGVNAGSLEKDLLKKYGGPTAEALAESALRNAAILEEMGFAAIK